MFISNNGASLYLWCKEKLVKHQKNIKKMIAALSVQCSLKTVADIYAAFKK